ncbi:MAG: RMD1 family protein [Geobacteraceae bacterium]|nr:RMD1 family protein [Geobacteraceae bacterium]
MQGAGEAHRAGEDSVQNTYFAGYALRGELDLNRLAGRLGITRKYRWEEAMVLDPVTLHPFWEGAAEDPQVHLYSFGAAVFVNCTGETVNDFCRRMSAHVDGIRDILSTEFHDEYSLRIADNGSLSITNDHAAVPRYRPIFSGIICFVIAKSVALERIEKQLDQVLDEVEVLMTRLERGMLAITDKRLARMASCILSFKYTSLASIMILDKPDSTWEDDEADRLYLTLAKLFELSQRYSEIRHKSDTLLDITEVFTSLSHARRASRLEWVIIILIFIEIVIFVVDIAGKRG